MAFSLNTVTTLRFAAIILLSALALPASAQERGFSDETDRIAADLLQLHSARSESGAAAALAVFPFDSGAAPSERSAADAISSLILPAIMKSGNFTLIERERLDQVMKEQAFQHSGAVTPESARAVGKLIGAEFLLLGRVALVEKRYLISARIVNVQTGLVTASASGEADLSASGGAVPVVRKNLREGRPQVRLEGGIFMRPHAVNWTGGIGLRSASQRYELSVDHWQFSKEQGAYFTGGPGASAELFLATRQMKAAATHLLLSRRFPFKKIHIPGLVNFNRSGAVSVGAGFGLYALKQSHNTMLYIGNALSPTPLAFYQDNKTVYFGVPVADLGLSHDINNALELAIHARYVHETAQAIGNLAYGGWSTTLTLAYRLF